MGTVAYMSPEQVRGEPLDARTDLFSLGIVLYEMATGRQAFTGTTTGVVFEQILNRDPPPPSDSNPGLPLQLDQIVSKALEKDKDVRYQTAKDLEADLKRLRRDTTSGRKAVTASSVAVSPTSGASATAVQVTTARAGSRRRPRPRGSGARRGGRARGRWLCASHPHLRPSRSRTVSAGHVRSDDEGPAVHRRYADLPDRKRSGFLERARPGGRQRTGDHWHDPGPRSRPPSSWGSTRTEPSCSSWQVAGRWDCRGRRAPLSDASVPCGSAGGRLGELLADDAGWSPDGRTISYTVGAELFLADASGANPRKIWTAPRATSTIPSFLPTAGGCACRSSTRRTNARRSGTWEPTAATLTPCCRDSRGSRVVDAGRRTADTTCSRQGPAFNPAVRRWRLRESTFGSWPSVRDSCHREAAHPGRLTQGPLSYDGPTWSRDGKKIFVEGSRQSGELVRCRLGSGECATYLGGMDAPGVSFSRTGSGSRG